MNENNTKILKCPLSYFSVNYRYNIIITFFIFYLDIVKIKDKDYVFIICYFFFFNCEDLIYKHKYYDIY